MMRVTMDVQRWWQVSIALIAAVVVFGGAASCQAKERAHSAGKSKASGASVSDHKQQTGDETQEGRLIVRTAQISVSVSDHQKMKQKAGDVVRELEGYVASSSVRGDYAELEVRVPQDRFRDALGRFRGMGRVLDESTTADDVTRKHRDLEAELRNKRQLESRLRSLLGSASSVDESLKIERELASVRSEIEKLESRVEGLEHDVDMSRISVNLYGPSSSAVGGFTTPIREAVGDVGSIVSSVIGGVIRLLAGLVPIALFASLGLYGLFWVKRRVLDGRGGDERAETR